MCQYTNGGERVNYFEFLAAREQLPDMGGFIPGELPSHLFDYQAQIVDWAVRQGRGGIFADCGLGKTPMSLASIGHNLPRPAAFPLLEAQL